MIELVVIMVIIGILAVVAIARMDTSGYRALEFHDKTVAALRYAQKTATSHRRLVCVTFPDDSTLTLSIALSAGAACSQPLFLPGTTSSSVVSGDQINAKFTSGHTAFDFQPDGSGSDLTISISSGQPSIVVVGTTGSVY